MVLLLIEVWMSEFEVRVEVKARAGPFPTGPKPGRITVVL